jgi:hypothetical protein
MRRLAYVASALCLLGAGVGVYSFWPSDTPPPPEEVPAEPAPPTADSAPASGTLVIEGEGLSLAQKQAVAADFRKLLSKAVHNSINKGWADLERKLRIAVDLERKLLATLFNPGPEPDMDSPAVWSVHLVRPGPAGRPPDTVEVTFERPISLRFTRVSAPVERPVAVTTLTWVQAGQLRQRERFLVYETDGEWREAGPSSVPNRGGTK